MIKIKIIFFLLKIFYSNLLSGALFFIKFLGSVLTAVAAVAAVGGVAAAVAAMAPVDTTVEE